MLVTTAAAFLLLAVGLAPAAEDPGTGGRALPRHILTNEGLVLLAHAGYDEDFLIDLIHRKQTRFDTSVEGLAYLASNGINESVVRCVLDHEEKPAAPAARTAAPALLIPARLEQQPLLVAELSCKPDLAAGKAGGTCKLLQKKSERAVDRWYILPTGDEPAVATAKEPSDGRRRAPAYVYYAYPVR